MKKIEDLKVSINLLEIEKEKSTNSKVKELIQIEIDKQKKELQYFIEKISSNKKRELNSKIGTIKIKMNDCKDKNDLENYLVYEKQLKELNKISRENKNEIKYLSINDINNILNTIDLYSTNKKRDKLLISLGFELGLRATEVLDLKIQDLYLENGEVLCRRKKNSIHNKIKLTHTTLLLLLNYIDEREDKGFTNEPYLFLNNKKSKLAYTGLNYIVKRFFNMANIPLDLQHYHILKHSRGVWLAEQDISIQSIKAMLGHKDIKNTLVYASYTPIKQENIANEVSKINWRR